MSAPTLVARWSSWGPQLRSVLRIVAALVFVQAGTVKLFAFPVGMPPSGGTASFPSQIWIGGLLEVVGGALLALVAESTQFESGQPNGSTALTYYPIDPHDYPIHALTGPGAPHRARLRRLSARDDPAAR